MHDPDIDSDTHKSDINTVSQSVELLRLTVEEFSISPLQKHSFK
jgi:hypothetical protein